MQTPVHSRPPRKTKSRLVGLCFLLTALFILGQQATRPAFAQDDGYDDGDLPSDFTGTLDDEEDEDNPEFQRKKIENEAFGNDRARGKRGRNDDAEEQEPEDDAPAYVLKMNFDSQVVFTDKQSGESTMQVNYNTKIEQDIALVHKRWRTKGEALFTSDIVGSLAGNDLFTCKLDITIDSYPVNIMTRLKTMDETEDAPESEQVALQIVLKNTYKEDWYSNCTGVDGSQFNTKGASEKYNMTILGAIEPDLYGIVIEDFDPSRGAEVELLSQPTDIVDEDMSEVISMSGSGTLTIDYVGASPQQ